MAPGPSLRDFLVGSAAEPLLPEVAILPHATVQRQHTAAAVVHEHQTANASIDANFRRITLVFYLSVRLDRWYRSSVAGPRGGP